MAEFNLEDALKRITENPDIMSKISKIAEENDSNGFAGALPEVMSLISSVEQNKSIYSESTNDIKSDTPPIKNEEITSNTLNLPIQKISEKISKNSKLLVALKPYLSKERADTLDSVLKMAQIADLMKLVK